MATKVTGIAEAKWNLEQLIGTIKGKKAVRAVTSALIIGGSHAAAYTPIDTSTLINSQFRELSVNGTRLTGRVGYSANYAVYVHDPRIVQQFRLPGARKEFLRRGFDDFRSEIDRAVYEEMSL